jgi:hypothetical protein
MKGKETTAALVGMENEILLLAEGRRRTGEELAEVKDLMRKLREGEVRVPDSLYCFNHGVAAKQKPNQLYPFLEKRSRGLTKEKAEWQRKLWAQVASVAGLLREGRVGGSSVDARVGDLLREWESQQEE